MTFSNDPRFVAPTVAMMMGSREAAVDYMTPLGLAHLMAAGHHYGPGAWQGRRSARRLDPALLSSCRRARHRLRSHHRRQRCRLAICAAARRDVQRRRRTPERYLLWFHHVPWDYRMLRRTQLWDELVRHYIHGVDAVHEMRPTWSTLASYVDAERYAEVTAFLDIQEQEAEWWRDATLAYFQSVSKRPFPPEYAPARSLADYEAITVPYAPGNPGWTAAPFRH